jgi:ribosomal protein S18 acetylase RimI-like enzyme
MAVPHLSQPDIISQDSLTFMEISIGTYNDLEAITGFQTAMALESEGIILDSERVRNGVTAVMQDGSKGIYLVARTEGRPVASLMITREWSDWNNGWYWWIQSVYVMPEYRDQGIFRAMYTKVIEMAKEQNITQVRLYVDRHNTNAQKVYQKLGMEECHYLMYETSTD